jgi:GTP-binding protein EngB required for normal cell division
MRRKKENIWTALLRGQQASEDFAGRSTKMRNQLLASGSELRAVRAAARAIRCAEAALRRPPRVAVMGESNSGKSALTNLLLGAPVLPTLQLANTRIPSLIRFSREACVAVKLRDGRMAQLTPDTPPQTDAVLVEIGLPIASLQACEILDLPGFADPLLAYDALDLEDCRIEASVWCTFSTQAWKESERAIWTSLSEGITKHSILVVTHMDKLKGDQAAKVMARLHSVANQDFKMIATLNSPAALAALDQDGAIQDDEAWTACGAGEFHAKFSTLLAQLHQERLERAQAFVRRIAGHAQDRIDRIAT